MLHIHKRKGKAGNLCSPELQGQAQGTSALCKNRLARTFGSYYNSVDISCGIY